MSGLGSMRRFSGGMLKLQTRILGTAKKIMTLQTNMLGLVGVMKSFQAFKSVITAFTDIESGMLKIKAVTGATGPELQKLRTLIDGLGLSTQFTTKDIAGAVFTLGTMGIKGAEAFEKLTPAIANAATALDLDMTRAAEIVLSTMRTFNLEIGQSARVVDTLTNMYTNSSMSAEKWAVAQQYAGLAAKTFDRELEDVLPLLMALSDQGIEASMAGTQIRTGFLKLLAPTGAAKKALSELGLTVDEINVKQHGFIGVLKKLEDAQMDNIQALSIFGVRAMPVINAIHKIELKGKKGVAVLEDYQKALLKSGEGARQAKERQQGLAFAILRLQASFDQLKITVGETLEKWFNLSGVTELMTINMGKLSNIIKALDFDVLKEAGINIFDPDEISQNIQNALKHVLPATVELFGAAGTYGVAKMLIMLEKYLAPIFISASRSMLALLFLGLGDITKTMITALKNTMDPLGVGHLDESVDKIKSGIDQSFSKFADMISGKKLEIETGDLTKSLDKFVSSFDKVLTEKQKTQVGKVIDSTKANLSTVEKESAKTALKNKMSARGRAYQERNQERKVAKRKEARIEEKAKFVIGIVGSLELKKGTALKKDIKKEVKEGIKEGITEGITESKKEVKEGVKEEVKTEKVKSKFLKGKTLEESRQAYLIEKKKEREKEKKEEKEKRKFQVLTRKEKREDFRRQQNRKEKQEPSELEKELKRLKGLVVPTKSKAATVEGQDKAKPTSMQEFLVQEKGKMKTRATVKQELAQKKDLEGSFKKEWDLKTLRETSETKKGVTQDNRHQIHHNYKAKSGIAGKIEKGKTRTPQGDSVS